MTASAPVSVPTVGMPRRPLRSALAALVLSLTATLAVQAGTDATDRIAQADPYAPWSQGRPGESLDLLLGRARSTDRWDAWYDAGLAAAAAGDKGQAVSYLVTAHQRNPAAAQPRDALRALEVPLPTTWLERAGPLGIPGSGWAGVALMGVAGLALGYGLVRLRRTPGRRGAVIVGAFGLAAIAAPGVIATLSDAEVPWITVVHDTQALDSTGAPIKALPAGTLVRREPGDAWAGRAPVRLDDGKVVLIALRDAR